MKYYLYNSKSNNGIRPEISDSIELIDAVGRLEVRLRPVLAEGKQVLIGSNVLWFPLYRPQNGC